MSEAAGERIDHSTVTQDDIDRASRSIKAMSHPLRLKILCILGDSEFSVQDIVDTVGTSQSNISQHLGILKDKGVLETRKEANKVFYRVSDERTLKLLEMIFIIPFSSEIMSFFNAINFDFLISIKPESPYRQFFL